jgi:hypothetical protein
LDTFKAAHIFWDGRNIDRTIGIAAMAGCAAVLIDEYPQWGNLVGDSQQRAQGT